MWPNKLIGRITGAKLKTHPIVQDKSRAQLRDGTLVIDCRGCHGEKDLGDQACMRCALKVLSRLPGFDRLVLSGSLDVAYEGGCVQLLRGLAEAVRLCREEACTSNDRSCSNCTTRPSLVLERLADSIPYHFDGLAPRVRPASSKTKCVSCSEKVNDIQSMITAKIRQIERASSREAFKVVGESGNA
jgi:hypothetical protein